MSDLPPSAAAPPNDELRQRIENTIAHYCDSHGVGEDVSARVLSERIMPIVAASREGGSSPDEPGQICTNCGHASCEHDHDGGLCMKRNSDKAGDWCKCLGLTVAPSRERAAALPPDLWAEIRAERERQDVKWGGQDHDDEHRTEEWVDYIVEHARKAERPALHHAWDRPDFRRRMIEVAALAVAAIESEDRKFPLRAAAPPEREAKNG